MPQILHRTWYLNCGKLPRDKATEWLKTQRDLIKENDVLPHGITSIDYFLPVYDQPTHVDVVAINTDNWQPTGDKIFGGVALTVPGTSQEVTK